MSTKLSYTAVLSTDLSTIPYSQLINELDQIYQKLVDLLTKIIGNLSRLNTIQKQKLWLITVESWMQLTKRITTNSITEQRILADCLNVISSLSLQLVEGTSVFNDNESAFALQILSIFFRILDLPHVTAFLSRMNRSMNEIVFFKNIQQIISEALRCAAFLPCNIDDEFGDNLNVFIVLKNYIDNRIPVKELRSDPLLANLLRLFWRFSVYISFIPLLIKIGLPDSIGGWLLHKNRTGEININFAEPILYIISNICRHDEGVDIFNKYGIKELIKEFQSKYLPFIKEEMAIAMKMVLTHLTSPENFTVNRKILNPILNKLLQLIIDCAHGEHWRARGYHVSEFLVVMVKLFVVEERTLDYILCHAVTDPPSDVSAIINLFCSILISFADALTRNSQLDQLTLIAIVNILWSISFQVQYLSELTDHNQEALEVIKTLDENNEHKTIKQYKPRAMEKLHVAAHGILHNIEKYSNQYKISNSNSLNIHSSDKPSIMISYCHSDRDFCQKIVQYLSTEQDQFDIWTDQTHSQISGDLWETIAAGMEQASSILCLISEYYFQSKSCRHEFIYATDTIHKRLVPVLIGECRPTGWLGIRMSGLKYIRFRNIDPLDDTQMSNVLETILSTLELSATVSSSAPVELQLPLNQWSTASRNDIRQWFLRYHISNKLHDLYDFQTGDEMLQYAPRLFQNEDNHLELYSRAHMRRYNGDELLPHEFLRFIIAMKELHNSNNFST